MNRRDAFLRELSALSIKYGAVLGGDDLWVSWGPRLDLRPDDVYSVDDLNNVAHPALNRHYRPADTTAGGE